MLQDQQRYPAFDRFDAVADAQRHRLVALRTVGMTSATTPAAVSECFDISRIYAWSTRASTYSAGASRPDRLRPAPKAVDQEINHRRGVKRQHLRDEQAADDGGCRAAGVARCPARSPAPTECRRKGPPSSSSGSAGTGRCKPRKSHPADDSPRWRSASSAKSTIMMPFFLTMPISKMIPTKAMMVSGVLVICSASNAPSPATAASKRSSEDWARLS